MSTADSTEPTRRPRRLRLGATARQSAREPKRPGPSRREELLDIAAELFAARGFVSVTVDDLGAAAGVSGPALYHHFESKEAMLGEMLVDISYHLLDAGRSLRDTVASAALLDELIAMHVDFAVDHRALISVHFRDLLQASPEDQRRVRRLQREYVEVWVDALVERHDDIAPAVARAAVHAGLGLINSTPFSPRARRADMVTMLRSMASAALASADPTPADVVAD
ncbi:MAG: TetR/AcrR family transcriptional regulator [Ilumatobacteraceae bacterium]